MHGNSRICCECGKIKPAKQFWQQAKRCRKCVARATAKLRTKRAKEWKKNVKQVYGLSLAISERRVDHEEREAHRLAESMVPKSSRDILAKWLALCGVLFIPGSALLSCFAVASQNWRPIIACAVFMFVLGPLLSVVAERWSAPRNTAIIDLTNVLLRKRLKIVETELREYLKFYTTPDWRALRASVIRRQGRICRRCGMEINSRRDVTVDHIKPRSRYPELALDFSNLRVLCRSCNSSKGISVESE